MSDSSSELSNCTSFGDESSTEYLKKNSCWALRKKHLRKREKFLRNTLREFVFFIIFFFILLMLTVGDIPEGSFNLNVAIKRRFVDTPYLSGVNEEDKMNFDEINSFGEIWTYLENNFMDSIFDDFWYYNMANRSENDTGDVTKLHINKILGVPRIRQVRVQENSCEVLKPLQPIINKCYSKFSKEYEDTESFGLENGTAWKYTSCNLTKATGYSGYLSYYSGSGFHQDIIRNKTESTEIINNLKRNLWIDRKTRAVFIDFVVENKEMNLFCIFKIIFELGGFGGVIPKIFIVVLKVDHFRTKWEYVVNAMEYLGLLFICYYTGNILYQLYQAIQKKRPKLIISYWKLVDLFIVCCCYVAVYYRIVARLSFGSALQLITKDLDTFVSFDDPSELHVLEKNMFGIILMTTWTKCFKFLKMNKRISLLYETLGKSMYDLLGLLCIFITCLLMYGILGFHLFGAKLNSFKSIGHAEFSLLQTVLGDFNYLEIQRTNPTMAPLYFITYLWTIIVLLDILIAILMGAYHHIMHAVAVRKDELSLTDFLKNAWIKFSHEYFHCKGCIKCEEKCIGKRSDEEKVRDILRGCGYSELEIEFFIRKYDISKNNNLDDFNLERFLERRKRKLYKTKLKFERKMLRLEKRLERLNYNVGKLTVKTEELMKQKLLR